MNVIAASIRAQFLDKQTRALCINFIVQYV